MDAVTKDVRLLVKKELAEANKHFPPFNSPHEGWAVIREELQEVEAEHYVLNQWVENRLWNQVKANRHIPKENLKEMQYHAVRVAVEAIQLAAMICKMARSQWKWEKQWT